MAGWLSVADTGFEDEAQAGRVLPLWIVTCGALLAMSVLLPLFGGYFAWEQSPANIPTLWLVIILAWIAIIDKQGYTFL